MNGEVAQWGLIGPGNIGAELVRQLGQEHVASRLQLSPAPNFIVRSSGIMEADGQTPTGQKDLADIDELPDVTFVAMNSTDDGEVAMGYISHILERGKKVVTAEKGAISNFFGELSDLSDEFNHLGINATVGGGTRLINVVGEYCQDPDNITQIHLALNGTLSTIMSSIGPSEGAGMSLGQAVDQAIKLGFAEPGAETPYDVIKQEAEADIPKKTAILFNALGLNRDDEYIDWRTLGFELSKEQISQLVEEAKIRRFIVSMYPTKEGPEWIRQYPEADRLGGFCVEHAGWQIVGGFRHIGRNPLFSNLANISGAGNGFVIGLGPNESDGAYGITGPGAGVSPTVNTMIDDYLSKKDR